MSGTILLYDDDGAGLFVTGCLERELQRRGNTVRRIKAQEVIADAWHDAAAFVLPGGADRPYIRKLAGAGNASIRSYVEAGGRFYGSCAGGYYAANRVIFNAPDLHVDEPRELAFVAASAVGPLPELAPPFRDDPDCAAVVTLEPDRLVALYWGGFHLVGQGFDVLARYPHGEVAAASTSVGHGRVVLCGLHPEATAGDVATLGDTPHVRHLAEQLKKHEAQRAACFELMWSSLMA